MAGGQSVVVPICPYQVLATAMAVPKLLYDRKSAAYALSISVRKLDYAIANKEINVRRIGGKVLIAASELKRYASADHLNTTAKKAA